MRVIIIEDEFHAAEKLKRLLNKTGRDLEVLAHLSTVQESIKWLNNHTVDLIFSDIHLGDAMCFEIFEVVNLNVPVIFTTAYDQYAIKAFQVNSVDYLLKPIRKEDLENAFNKLESRKSFILPIQQLRSEFGAPKHSYQRRFSVNFGEEIRTVKTTEIAYFFAEGKYVYLMTNDGKEYIVEGTLDKLLDKLDPEQFFKINRQYIVSIDAIDKMYSYPKGRVKLQLKPREKKDAIVSIERSAAFKAWLNN